MVLVDMEIPTNCAHCPMVVITVEGARCGTETGKDKKICADSLYFDDFRPKWCPIKEVKDGI